MPTSTTSRRPLKTRDWAIFRNLAAGLARIGVTPNAISFSSMIFGVLAGGALATTAHVTIGPQRACWLAAAAFIQLRLIANLLDGMVAVEGGRGGPTGELWNEAPDRVADAAILMGAGFASGSSPLLGMGAALVAVFVAYVRALGAGVGAGQIFIGPMAKPHRMALITLACVLSAILPPFSPLPIDTRSVDLHLREPYSGLGSVEFFFHVLPCALVIVILGGLITAVRRLRRIALFLRNPVHR